MLSESDVFLLLASLQDFYPDKQLIKKIHQLFNVTSLLTSNIDLFKSKLSPQEIEKIKFIRDEIKKYDLSEIKKKLNKTNIRFLPYGDNKYPVRLKALMDSPVGLFYKGDVSILNSLRLVAIVGTRQATSYGLKIAKEISSIFSSQGIVIVSGLASGIDSSAHYGALEGGKTIAVLGTGVDVIYPAGNRSLFEQIINKGGLIVSEYPQATYGMPWNFPQRNRIISSLSDAVIVVEGGLQSGAMITARFAIKQNKPLFALPGPVNSNTSNGPNILIKSGVAELLTSASDVLEKIGIPAQTKLKLETSNGNPHELNERQKNIYKLLSSQPTSFDDLLNTTNLEAKELMQNLSILELKGFIEKTVEGGYVRC